MEWFCGNYPSPAVLMNYGNHKIHVVVTSDSSPMKTKERPRLQWIARSNRWGLVQVRVSYSWEVT